MITNNTDGFPVHTPNNPNKFEFDVEVARIFDNMAERSIPMYREARSITTKLAVERIHRKWAENEVATVVDVGASTGAFFRDLWFALGYELNQEIPDFNAIAIDSSKPMLDRLSMYHPKVVCLQIDALEIRQHVFDAEVVNLAYVVQFLRREKRPIFFNDIYSIMNKGGLLICSQKDRVDTHFSDEFADQYMQFRKDNRYTEKEIADKTKALSGSMWPQPYDATLNQIVDAGFQDPQEVCRWLQFSTLVANKR